MIFYDNREHSRLLSNIYFRSPPSMILYDNREQSRLLRKRETHGKAPVLVQVTIAPFLVEIVR